MQYYIGLDVSQRQTAICIIDSDGERVKEGKALTIPSDIYGWIIKQVAASDIIKVVHEAGAMSFWLQTELTKLGLPIVCMEAFQAAALLKTQRNKNDKNDARGLAQIAHMGGKFIRPVIVRSQDNQEARMLLTMRQHLVERKVALENNITGSLKPFGLVTPRGKACAKKFRENVLATVVRAEERGVRVRETIMPSLDHYEDLRKQLDILTKRVSALANASPVCRRLMTVPGVGPIVALSFATAVDDPKRFRHLCDVGAYFGLTPRQEQSGEMDKMGSASRRGNTMTRTHLVQAATVLLCHSKKWCSLKAWGMKLAKRHGLYAARVAVARKLAIVLCSLWLNEQDFCWTTAADCQELAEVKPA
jgi:transposase